MLFIFSSRYLTKILNVRRFTPGWTGESGLEKNFRATLSRWRSQSLCMQVQTSQEATWENPLLPERIPQAHMLLGYLTACLL